MRYFEISKHKKEEWNHSIAMVLFLKELRICKTWKKLHILKYGNTWYDIAVYNY